MTIKEKAIIYFKDLRKRFCDDYLLGIPKNTVAYKERMVKKEFYDTAIEALEQTRWISLSESLPEDGTWNLFTDGDTISVERYEQALNNFYPEGRWFSFEDAVAWMPSPELPKARK